MTTNYNEIAAEYKDVYSHVSLELQKQAAARLNAALMGKQ
jgi:hypothetical protein